MLLQQPQRLMPKQSQEAGDAAAHAGGAASPPLQLGLLLGAAARPLPAAVSDKLRNQGRQADLEGVEHQH